MNKERPKIVVKSSNASKGKTLTSAPVSEGRNPQPLRTELKPAAVIKVDSKPKIAAQPQKQTGSLRPDQVLKRGTLALLLLLPVMFLAYRDYNSKRQASAVLSELRSESSGDYFDPESYEVKFPPLWENPDIGFFEKIFCRGYQNARSCSYAPKHPFVAVCQNDPNCLKYSTDPLDKTIAQRREIARSEY